MVSGYAYVVSFGWLGRVRRRLVCSYRWVAGVFFVVAG
jgi:hypothetical protein